MEKSVIHPPMVFVTFGLLVGSWGFSVVPSEVDTPLIDLLATITLVLVLFTDASRIDLELLRREQNLPLRLLGVGLPLTILFGMIAAKLMFGNITLWEAGLLAAILAPTDAALGQAVVNSPKLPVRIRQTLNVESGLNDGLALPVVLIFLSFASGQQEKETGEWIWFVAKQVGLGPLAGIAVGYFGGKLVLSFRWATKLFLGWFGPRGIASILYVLFLLEGSDVAGIEVLLSVVITTVLLSVFAHGITAFPGSIWYANYTKKVDPDAAENEDVAEMPVRLSFTSAHASDGVAAGDQH